jgi:hypothetical protein
LEEDAVKIDWPAFEAFEAGSTSLVKLHACSIAYERFKTDGFTKLLGIAQYTYSILESGKLFFVHFCPDLRKIEGGMFGGAVTYAVDAETSAIIKTRIYK